LIQDFYNSGESSVFGGGVVNDGVASNLVLRDCRLLNNAAMGGDVSGGGAIANESPGGSVSIIDSTLESNSSWIGGGLFNARESTLMLLRTTVTDNQGGGIYNVSGTLMLVNSTVSANPHWEPGAGIYNRAGTVTLRNATVTRNLGPPDAGAGLFNDGGTIDLANSIVADNNPDDCRGSVSSSGFNLIGNDTGCTISGDTTGNIVGVDPLLGPLRNNGGPTPTHALMPASPCLDAGDPSGCSDADGQPLMEDQRGEPRPVDCGGGDRCDMGAYESACTPGPVVYESSDPSRIVDPVNAVGTASASPYLHPPGPGDPLYYQLDDGSGFPSLISIVKGGAGLLISF
jgi:hypothetical protein